MREVTQKVYSIKELEAKAKEKALDKLRELGISIVDHVIEDWVEILTEFGFSETKIAYSVSWSQGDGASFTSDKWQYPKGIKETIAKEYPNHEFLNEVAVRVVKLFRDTAYMGLFEVTRDGYSHYVHENTVTTDYHDDSPLIPNDKVLLEAKHIVQSLGHRIYRDLKAELEYQASEEYLTDFAMANDYEFLQDGSIFKECL